MPHVTALRADDPTRVGRYRLVGRIAGMPAPQPVYLAHAIDGSEVTVAMLTSDATPGGGTPGSAADDRFAAEAAAARQVVPFCAARIVDSGVDGGRAFLVREHVAGPSLLELIAADGVRDGQELLALAIGAATGLAAIHQAGLVHGDFGPEHLILGADGPRVVEFGITPPYGAATPAADMLAWAQTMVFAAAARPPAVPADLDVLPQPLRQVALGCLSPDPAARPAARAVVVALLGVEHPAAGVLGEGSRRAALAARRPSQLPQPPVAAQRPGPGRRGRLTAVLLAACAIAAVAVIAVLVHRIQDTGSRPGAAAAGTAGAPGSSAPAPQSSAPSATPSPQLSSPSAAGTIPRSLAGSWSGQVRQASPADEFSVLVHLTAASQSGTIVYSGASFRCAGDLTLLHAAGRAVSMHQQIVDGRTTCEDGIVTLRSGSPGTLVFTFRGKAGPRASGTLARH